MVKLTSLRADGAVGEGLGRELLADADQADAVHLNNVVVHPDPAIKPGHGLLHHAFHVDVELVGDAVDHVDPDDPDAQAGWRRQARVHHEVDLHQVHLVDLLLELILEPRVEQVVPGGRGQDGVTSRCIRCKCTVGTFSEASQLADT